MVLTFKFFIMKTKAYLTRFFILVFLTILMLVCMGGYEVFGQESSNDSTIQKVKYVKIAFSERNFNNSLFNDVGILWGVEVQGGIEIKKDLTAELHISRHWKKVNKDEKFQTAEVAVLFDYHPADFYLGIGPALASVTYSVNEKNEYGISIWKDYSENAIGFEGRIGYETELFWDVKLYIEVKYSKINIEDDGEKTDVGTTGVSFGIKFPVIK